MIRYLVLVGLMVACGKQNAARPAATSTSSHTPAAAVTTRELVDASQPRDAQVANTRAPSKHLVDLSVVAPEIVIEMRYATTNNFTGVQLYEVAKCLLRPKVAERLARVQEALSPLGLGLKVWDCYRPFFVQERLYKVVSNPDYVAEPQRRDGKPHKGSRHNRGAAVDLTLVDKDGAELVMPTAYDDFSPKARANARAPAQSMRNRTLLRKAMVAQGFKVLPTEWWHFDATEWESYPLLDEAIR